MRPTASLSPSSLLAQPETHSSCLYPHRGTITGGSSGGKADESRMSARSTADLPAGRRGRGLRTAKLPSVSWETLKPAEAYRSADLNRNAPLDSTSAVTRTPEYLSLGDRWTASTGNSRRGGPLDAGHPDRAIGIARTR
jgi:hypothetical protein